ncbi:MAG: hypothetical protein J6X67_00610 [Treponema sp.]|nr:hypothetical protein [Treponema sp.]
MNSLKKAQIRNQAFDLMAFDLIKKTKYSFKVTQIMVAQYPPFVKKKKIILKSLQPTRDWRGGAAVASAMEA